MTRTLTAGAETASLASHVRPVVLVRIELTSETLRLTSADRTITFASADYLGVGDFGKITPFGEPTDLSVDGVALELSGVPSDYITIATGENVQGRPVYLYLGFLNDSYALIADPVLIFRGRLDTMEVTLGETATVTVRAENRFADWDRPRIRRYTDQDQRARFPTDKGLEFVAQTTEREIVWGRA